MRKLLQLSQLLVGQNGSFELQEAATFGRWLEQIAFGPKGGVRGSNDGFAQVIDWGIGYLGKKLLEVVVKQLRLVRKHSQGVSVPIDPNGSTPSFAIGIRMNRSSSNVYPKARCCWTTDPCREQAPAAPREDHRPRQRACSAIRGTDAP
jgi:hypothetical protein